MLRICQPGGDPRPEGIDDTVGSVGKRLFEGFGDAFREVRSEIGEGLEGKFEIMLLVSAEDIGIRVVGLADELASESDVNP